MPNGQSTPQRKRSSSGSLLLLGLAVAFLLFLVLGLFQARKAALAEQKRLDRQRREEIVAEVRSGETRITLYDARLLEMLIEDPVCRENVKSIDFFMANLGDSRYRRVCDLPNVTDIFFYDCAHADNVMAALHDMPNIESLVFEVTLISDESMRSLTALPKLKHLQFEQVVPDATIDSLKQSLPHVKIEACLESEEKEYRRKVNQGGNVGLRSDDGTTKAK